MKLIAKYIDKYRKGKITLTPENDDDIWSVYNLIEIGDRLRSSTLRKVQTETSTGTVNVKQVRTNVTIEIETIECDSYGSEISINGRNVEENDYVKMGAYHSLTISHNLKFSLWKDEWDSIALDIVAQCTEITNHADVAAVIMQEGLAYICLLTKSATIVRCKIDINIPQKRKGVASQHDKALDKFIDQVTEAIERNVNFEVIKCVILASPGFLKDKLFEHITRVAVEKNKKVFHDNKSKFLLVHSSTGHKHSLNEVLKDPIVQNRMADTKATSETKALENFYKMLKNDPNRAFYGVKHVFYANESNAIETLLISDSLFKSKNFGERRKFVDMVDSVRYNNGIVKVFSSCHISGEQLNNLTGIAAILRFPIDEPESDGDSSETDNEDDFYEKLSNFKFNK